VAAGAPGPRAAPPVAAPPVAARARAAAIALAAVAVAGAVLVGAALAGAILAAGPAAGSAAGAGAAGDGGRGGVKHGDAVGGIIKRSDLERIRGILDLDRFSILAAVWLGATAGREAVLAEPLPADALALVKESCEADGFCPDPTGFVAGRVRVLLLQNRDVHEVVRVDAEARGGGRRLFDPRALGMEGELLGWTGHAEAYDGHVALVLTPLARFADGGIGAGADPPFLIRWNDRADRFQLYDCTLDEDGGTRCGFVEDEPG
jgi:hypothetical protein